MDQGQRNNPRERGLGLKAFIFDLDGTLLNTLADIASACNFALAEHDYPQHPLAAYALMVGNGFETLVKRALPEERMPDALAIKTITQEARERYASHMMEATRPYPGMAEALAALAREKAALGVLSNKPDALSAKLIAHYFPDTPFIAVQGALQGKPLKPDPETLLAMLAKAGIPASSARYVGDSDVDMLTARNAGVMGVGAAWGFRGREELERAGADIIIASPAELIGLG